MGNRKLDRGGWEEVKLGQWAITLRDLDNLFFSALVAIETGARLCSDHPEKGRGRSKKTGHKPFARARNATIPPG